MYSLKTLTYHIVRTSTNSTSLRMFLKVNAIIMVGALVVFTSLPAAYARTLEIKAEFNPNPANTQHNVFVNKTDNNGGYCHHNPGNCEAQNIQSLKIITKFEEIRAIEANHSNPRDGAMITIPGEWRSLTVRNSRTQQEEIVELRISGAGTSVSTNPGPKFIVGGINSQIAINEGHDLLWAGGNWSSLPQPCTSVVPPIRTTRSIDIFISVPPQRTVCARQALFDIDDIVFNYLDFSYELRTPNPLTMSTGEYKGTILYELGPGKDFDMGDVMIPSDSELRLNFTLTVQHSLQVNFPPGADKVELIPEGGWQQWLQKGRIPEKLYRDQFFLMSSSSRFKMQLVCDQEYGETCAISNGSHQVPVDVLVSMPNGVANDDNSAVSRKPLLTTADLLFRSTFYVEQKPSTLHFEIQKQYVEEMLDKQGKYSGNITVVWDSDL